MTPHLQTIISLIDHANAADPNIELDHKGVASPKELLYSQRMTTQLMHFIPEASEELQIAARAQHIERWTSQRSDYPEGRTGYKKWRANLGLFHAKRTGELMVEAGYDDDKIKRVEYIVQKRGLKHDVETQALEDVICLVFLEYYLNAFAQKHSEEKLITIIQKTWAKMSDKAHEKALKLSYTDDMLNLIQRALAD